MWLTDQQQWHHLEFVRQAGQAHPDLKNQNLHINKIPGQCMCGRVLVKCPGPYHAGVPLFFKN